MKRWTPAEVKDFIQLYPTTRTKDLMARFDASESSIRNKATALGLKKTSDYLSFIGHDNLMNLRWYRERQEQT